jgi:hypothetical protein
MRKEAVLLAVVLSCALLFFSSGCKKAEEIKKPEISKTAPTPPPPPPSEMSTKREVPTEKAPAEKKPPIVSHPIQEKVQLPEPEIPPKEIHVPSPPSPDASTLSYPAPTSPGMSAKKDIVLVAGFDSAHMQKGAPAGWILDRIEGTPVLKLEKSSEIYCLHMRSDSESSFGVKKEIKVDIKEYPYLNWRWKATRLPDGGDVRKTDTDDQAIQLYVAFAPTGFPARLNTNVVGYIWDDEAPKGWTGRSSRTGGGKLRYLVVRNKTDHLGQWYTEKRNIYDDYKKLFKDIKGGEPPGPTHGIQFHINSQHTESEAESYICEVFFSKT